MFGRAGAGAQNLLGHRLEVRSQRAKEVVEKQTFWIEALTIGLEGLQPSAPAGPEISQETSVGRLLAG